jgi:pimeloyl-ACP methyl ester carboxylesterase
MPIVTDRVAGASPEKWLLFLHGILGSGANWRTFAKQLVAEKPAWGAILADLRLHGGSQGEFPLPHGVERAAEDLLGVSGVNAVLGHSFGGKVALAFAKQRPNLEHVFVIDASPSARPGSTHTGSTRHIVDLLTTLPHELPDRNAFTAWVEERGVSRAVAMWLAMNLRPIPNTTRYAFRLDMPNVRAMVDDYFVTDLWSVLEDPSRTTAIHLVVGGKSDVVTESDRDRAARCPRTTVDVIDDAGHWVHVDAPDRLRAIVASRI